MLFRSLYETGVPGVKPWPFGQVDGDSVLRLMRSAVVLYTLNTDARTPT